MQICQNPNCPNPFNPDGNKFCISCGQNNFGNLLRNRYRVKELLGQGGFGRTYTTEDADRLNAPCVIKQFFPQMQGTAARTKAAELFKQEAQRLYELGENHPQIPRLLAYFEQGSSLYLVQEFIQGQTLLKELQQQAFNETQIWELLADLLPVLQFTHESNVIHRDIKPENIIRRHSDGQLVLIDFGGAKQVTETSIARQATGIYTIGYAPTEQMSGYVSPASDLYALGATCARLLTQCLPSFDANGNLYDRLYDGFNARWLWRELLQEKGVTISDNLGQIIDRLLKHLARERYQSAAEVLRDLNTAKSSVLNIPQPQSPPLQQNLGGAMPYLQTFEFDVVTVNPGGREISRKSTANFFAENLGNGVILEMVSIPGGTFMMGSPDNRGEADERPEHKVTVKPFFLGKFPVTQAQWQAVAALPQVKQSLKPNPSKFKGVNLPVENVSWHDAVEFCARLSQKTGRHYRLPSEAEWEYACRAGTTTRFYFGETITTGLANYDGRRTYDFAPKGTYLGKTTLVGSFQAANAFGLPDMHGLVWEWCADPWHKNYRGAPTDGKVWEVGGNDNRRILRGGSWCNYPVSCRSVNRGSCDPYSRFNNNGFRVVVPSSV